MNDSFVVKKAFAAYLINSAVGDRDDDRGARRCEEVGDTARRRLVARSNDGSIGCEGVLHRGALAEKLRVRDHAHEGAVEQLLHSLSGAHRHRRLDHEDRVVAEVAANLVDHVVDLGHVRSSVGGHRRRDAHEHDRRVADRHRRVLREGQSTTRQRAREQVVEPLFNDRTVSVSQ